MKTLKEIRIMRRSAEKGLYEAQKMYGALDPSLTGYIAALDWVMMPSNEEAYRKIDLAEIDAEMNKLARVKRKIEEEHREHAKRTI